MDILILGNGFDLAHDLKTSYTDFLNYCRKNNIIGGNVWLKHFYNRKQELGNKWIDLEEEIYNVITNINKGGEYLIKNYTNRYFSMWYYPETNYYSDDIFDLGRIIDKLKHIKGSHQTGEREYACFNKDKINYSYYFKTYKGFINFLYDQLREVTEIFDKYLTNEIMPKIGSKKYKFSLANRNSVRVLNFNYTDTCEKLYPLPNIYGAIKPKCIYVHGKVCNSSECNLILGTHSFYNHLPNDLNEEINVEFNIFKKHNQRHHYGTIEAYQELLGDLKNKKRVIEPIFHVIGHSLDTADHNILRHIFLAKENSKINVYYHTQEALDRLIRNVTEIIGEEETMTKVRFIKQDDPQRGILIPQEEMTLTKN